MHDLNRTHRSVLLGFGLVLTPPAFDPTAAPEPSENVLRIVEPEADDEPALAPEAEPETQPSPASEPSDAEPIELAVEPPAPTLEPEPAPLASVRMIDSKRPAPGTGLIALGSMGLVASSGLIVTALAGPGWLGLDRQHAAIAGGLSIPLAMTGVALVAVGDKSARRFRNWSSNNQLSPPESGNGLLVIGAFTTLGFAGTAAYASQWALTKPNPQRVDWIPTAVAGGATLVGMLLLTTGMLKRSKFASWERQAYALPGAMALEHGGGVSVAGRF
jgi:hypothetical protein